MSECSAGTGLLVFQLRARTRLGLLSLASGQDAELFILETVESVSLPACHVCAHTSCVRLLGSTEDRLEFAADLLSSGSPTGAGATGLP